MDKLNRDGVALAYRDEGAGSPTVLVHGWCCDSTHFQAQAEHLRTRHRVISIELRGHGQSDAPDQDYSIDGFADDVAWMCRELEVTQPIVVGHSMGGAVALALAARRPELARAIVMLDGAVFFPAAVLAEARPVLDLLRSPEYRAVIHAFSATSMFTEHDDQARKEATLARMSATPQRVAATALESLFHFASEEAASRCTVPAMYVAADPQRADLALFQQLCPQLMIGRTVGSGHFHGAEVPDQVNAMLDRFIAIVERGA